MVLANGDSTLVDSSNQISSSIASDPVEEAVQSTTMKPLSGFSFSALFRGLLGMASLLLIAFLFSENRKAISWSLVGKGLLLQIIFALLVLKVPLAEQFFEMISKFFVKIISFTNAGSDCHCQQRVFCYAPDCNRTNNYFK